MTTSSTICGRAGRESQRLQDALRTEPNVAAGILFGSVARGDDRPSSDVDILVELRKDTPTEAIRLQERLSQALDTRVQVTRASSAELTPEILLSVLDDGRPLVDRSNAWPRLTSRRNGLRRAAAARVAKANERLVGAFGIEFVNSA